MCSRNLVFITLLAVCHLRLGAQTAPVLTNPVPSPQSETSSGLRVQSASVSDALPDDPSQEIVPVGQA